MAVLHRSISTARKAASREIHGKVVQVTDGLSKRGSADLQALRQQRVQPFRIPMKYLERLAWAISWLDEEQFQKRVLDLYAMGFVFLHFIGDLVADVEAERKRRKAA